MAWVISGLSTLMKHLSDGRNNDTVVEVKPDDYGKHPIYHRDEAIVLYGPMQDTYDIVLHRPFSASLYQAYSLYRTNNLPDAETKFLLLKDKIPLLIETSSEACTIAAIQRMCDILKDHPGWSVAHLAAHFGFHESLLHAKVKPYLSQPDLDTGMCPLHVAIEVGNLRTVQILTAAEVPLDLLDKNGNTVFHLAASKNKDIIQALTKHPLDCLNFRNVEGYTPLHVACLADKPDCVRSLLLAGADVNIAAMIGQNFMGDKHSHPGLVQDFVHEFPHKLQAQDMKYGGTPLHWSSSPKMIQTLVEMGCNVDSLNFEGKTALHVMILRDRLECAVALMSRGAKVNVGDPDGNTPLHFAVKNGMPSVVQALIVFGADLNYKNFAGATPRHVLCTEGKKQQGEILYLLHAVGAERCPLYTIGCTPGCGTGLGESFDGVPKAPILNLRQREVIEQALAANTISVASYLKNGSGQKGADSKGATILCLDGGGIRGLVLVEMLLELEQILQVPLPHYFDWVAGTSTGGIVALGLACGKSLRECLMLYFQLKEAAFQGNRPYRSEPLEGILQKTFGLNTVMADIDHPKVMVTGVLADRKPADLHFFRNYESPEEILHAEKPDIFPPPPRPEEQLVWRAARATGAAPSYFRTFGRFLDGGLIANNPTLDALTEVHEYNTALRAVGRENEAINPRVIVSFGTGMPPVTQVNSIDVFRPESIWDTAKLAFGVSALGSLLVDQATAVDGRIVDRARAWCSMIGVPYFRFTPQLSSDILMDEKSDEILVNMLWETKVYMRANLVKLHELAAILKENKDL